MALNNRSVITALNDRVLAENISTQLVCFGYKAHSFTHAEICTEALLLQQADLVIMDIDFGTEGGGIALLDHCYPKLSNKPKVLYVAKHNDLKSRLLAVRHYGDAYHLSPVDCSALLEQVDELLAQNTQTNYKILIIEDSKAQSFYIGSILTDAGMQTAAVNNPLELDEVLGQFQPDLILMDVYLPTCSGIELAQVIRQQDAYVSVPIVFLSQEHSISEQMKAMLPGGDDFLTKPITNEHLISAVQYRAARSRILRGHMIKDSLTGLLNHTNQLAHLDIEISRSRRTNEPLCYAMLDLDHFKTVNDRYGHPVGDKVIKSLAHLLQQRLRRTDIIGRYGGEEFSVILPNTSLEQACQLFDTIRTHFGELNHFSRNHSFKTTVSVGIACLLPNHDTQQLNEQADRNLYRAKQLGRNQIHPITTTSLSPDIPLPTAATES